MRRCAFFLFAAIAVSLAADSLRADPCGMVPPVYVGDEIPITRIGAQQTFVFYKDGLETIVLRPGFEGNVDEFGMLIPFPSPPAIRKMPENIFEQLAAAVDPPEVVVDLRPQPAFAFGAAGGFGGGGGAPGVDLAFNLEKNEVKVLREEAVGMYEVAVLAAGSSAALKRWMDDHGYIYPEGMDDVCDDYVADRWCFVAVKTKVGQKEAADARPGQRQVNNELPLGAGFDGHVQAMGFRFPSKELVVPMRLSAFNAGELRNVVYLLTDKPSRIRMIPEEFVVRQISGARLYKNLTGPLPLRVIGGTLRDVPRTRLRAMLPERDPRPHNGAAAELFAGDLVAQRTGRLLSEHERDEKEMVQISERLALRGVEIDDAVAEVTREKREKDVRAALEAVKEMTLTVVDGDFPREVLAKQNLTFADYRIPSRRNHREVYDAKQLGLPPEQEGTLYLGEIRLDEADEQIAAADKVDGRRNWLSLAAPTFGVALFAMFAILGAAVLARRRR